jgi:hypothetical protein
MYRWNKKLRKKKKKKKSQYSGTTEWHGEEEAVG